MVSSANSSKSLADAAAQRVATILRDWHLEERIVTPGGQIVNATRTASQLGVTTDQIAKTVLCLADDEPVLVVVRGSDRVPIERVRSRLDVSEFSPAPARRVGSLAGFPVDGVSPIGSSPRVKRVLIDRQLDSGHDLYVSAGNNRTVFRVSFAELVRIVGEDGALF